MTGRAAPAPVLAAVLLLAGCAGAPQTKPAPAPVSAPAAETAAETAALSAPEPAAPEPALEPESAEPEAAVPAEPEPAAPPPAPAAEPEEPAFSVFTPTPQWTAADLDGRTADAVRALLGAPDFTRDDPPAAYWRYGGADCALDVFLYAETADAPRTVRHTDMRWDAGAKTAGQCLDDLRRRRPPDGADAG